MPLFHAILPNIQRNGRKKNKREAVGKVACLQSVSTSSNQHNKLRLRVVAEKFTCHFTTEAIHTDASADDDDRVVDVNDVDGDVNQNAKP